MSQTSITAGALVIAFFIFITVRGELPYYLGAFGLGPMPLQPKAPGAGGGAPGGSNFTVSGPGGAGVGVGPGGVAIGLPGINIGFPGGGNVGIGGPPSYGIL